MHTLDLVCNKKAHTMKMQQSINVGGQYLTDTPYDGTSKKVNDQLKRIKAIDYKQTKHDIHCDLHTVSIQWQNSLKVNLTMKYHYLISIKCIILEENIIFYINIVYVYLYFLFLFYFLQLHRKINILFSLNVVQYFK